DNERIEQRTELYDHHEINQLHREYETEAKRLKRIVHRFHLAAHLDVVTLRNLAAVVFNLVDVTLDVARDRADIAPAPAHIDENVGHTGDIKMVDLGISGAARKFRDSAQSHRCRLIFARDRDVEDRVDRLDVVLAVLRADEIVVAVFLIDPKRGRKIDRAVERSDDVFDDLLLCQTNLRSLDSVNVDIDLRRVEPLLNAHIDSP